jgi:hypothetical protein
MAIDTWSGFGALFGGSNDWFVDRNWQSGSPPAATDIAEITAGANLGGAGFTGPGASLSGAATVAELRFCGPGHTYGHQLRQPYCHREIIYGFKSRPAP